MMTAGPDPAVDVSRRRREAAIAGHTNSATSAVEFTRDDDPTVRSIALGALARLRALTPELLQRASVDESPIVRRRAAELLGKPGAEGELGSLLEDQDASVVEVAAWAAGEQVEVDEATFNRLTELATTHPAPLVRESAVAALGAIGDPRGLPAILHGCEDKPAIRRRAVLALAPFDGPEVDAAIVQAEHDRDWQVRQSALVLTRVRDLGALSQEPT